jgi:hypothetical protein
MIPLYMDQPATLERLFGKTATIRILDYCIDNAELDYTLTDVAEGTDVAWSTLCAIWPRLTATGMVVKTRKIGRATLFRLDRANPVVTHLIAFDAALTMHQVEQKRGRHVAIVSIAKK